MASSLRYPDLFEIEGGFGPQGIRALPTAGRLLAAQPFGIQGALWLAFLTGPSRTAIGRAFQLAMNSMLPGGPRFSKASALSRLTGIVRHVLNQFFNRAVEELAQAVEHVRGRVVAFLAAEPGERYAVYACASSDFIQRNSVPCRKRHVGNSLLEPESDHVALTLPKEGVNESF